jgi:TIR domain-containing protein
MASDSELDIRIVEASGAYTIYVASIAGLSYSLEQNDSDRIADAKETILTHANRLQEALVRCGIVWKVPTEFQDAAQITQILRESTFVIDIANCIVGKHSSRQEYLWWIGCLLFFVFGERARGEQNHGMRPHLLNYAELLHLPVEVVDACLNQTSIQPLKDWLASREQEDQDMDRLYFLSYARRNSVKANQVELQLIRGNRRIWRDETDIRAGGPLLSSLYSGIDEAHTFVCLLSQQYVESNWCMEELERAIHKHVSTGKPRFVALRTDDYPLPSSVTTRLWLDASSPEKLQLAVSQILHEEGMMA